MVVENGLPTVDKMLQWAVLFLTGKNRLAIELLLAQALNCTREKLWANPDWQLTGEQKDRFKKNIKALQQGEPLQYLLGQQNFMGLDFVVDQNVLIPRHDTEVLVEEALKIWSNQGACRVLDLCTGSGAIAISLAKYLPLAQIVAVDISKKALQIARMNNHRHGTMEQVVFLAGDLFFPLDPQDQFDLIISNPPYITSAEMAQLSPQVKREPSLALWGGQDGLVFYRRIISQSAIYLKSDGYLLLEIGFQQGLQVQKLYHQYDFKEIKIIKDWAGHHRVVSGRCP